MLGLERGEGTTPDGRQKRTMQYLSRKATLVHLGILLCLLGVYLIAAHYVKAYSDPVGFLYLAESMRNGHPVTSRAFVYPALLISALNVLGRAYVFWVNLPFIFTLLILSYIVTVHLSAGSRTDGQVTPEDRLAGLLAVWLLVLANRLFFLEILNPFREPLTFSLALGAVAVVLAARSRPTFRHGAASGALLGLAISTRETCVLILPPIVLWTLYGWFRKRERDWWRLAVGGVAGIAIGLVPFFLQNHMHSGNVAVPSYAADKVAQVANELRWDIPVPGMSLKHFSETGKTSVAFLLHKYAWLGGVLLLTGAVRCFARRNRAAVLLFLPAFLLSLLFYCFYWCMKERYLFVTELFFVPVMALGLTVCLTAALDALEKRARSSHAALARRLVMAAILVSTAVTLVHAYYHKDDRLQTWHVKAFRSHVIPKLEKPYTFLGQRHSSYMLAWHLEGSFHELCSGFDPWQVMETGLDEALRGFGVSAIDRLRDGQYYIYGDARPPLLRSWFDFENVLSFRDIPVPVDHYGKRLTEGLYRVSPWSQTNVSLTLDVPRNTRRAMLMVDCHRLWDYAGRTFCRLHVNGKTVEHCVTNGLHFVEWTAETNAPDRVDVTITSDAPLPAEPVLAMIPANSTLDLPLGSAAGAWPYPLLSHDLIWRAPLKGDACILLDRGAISLPCLCTSNRTAYAVFILECVREDPHFRGHETITVSSPSEQRTADLPGRRIQGSIGVELARGSGSLVSVPLDLRSTLPDMEEQWRLSAEGTIERFGHIKLSAVRIFSVRTVPTWPLDIDIGTLEDCVWQLEGFHGIEKNVQGHTARWTSGQASLVFPAPVSCKEASVEIHTIRTRPDEIYEAPRFTVNAIPIGPENTEREERSGNEVVYRLRLGEHVIAGPGTNSLQIASTPWTPAEIWGTADDRTLGHLVHRVAVDAEQTDHADGVGKSTVPGDEGGESVDENGDESG